MIGILGSGFGLYGYLPAVCQYYPSKKVLLLNRAKNVVQERIELRSYLNRIFWVEHASSIFDNVNLLVVSYPPFEVSKLKRSIIQSKTIETVIIEKPVCESPSVALDFINSIERSGKKIISSFLFIYSDWNRYLINSKGNYKIDWKIVNVNQKSSWKWNVSLGGGILRFYGIHLVATCAFHGLKLSDVIVSSSEESSIIFSNGMASLNIVISYSSRSSFIVNNEIECITPFGAPSLISSEDLRVPYLISLLKNLESDYIFLNKLLKETIFLWKEIEDFMDKNS